MKVKVRKVSNLKRINVILQELAKHRELDQLWPALVRQLPTDRLQRLVQMDRLQNDDLFVVLEELVRRREISGTPFRSNEEAWAEFVEHYMPKDDAEEPSEEDLLQALQTPHALTPSPQGRECLGNGNWPGYACQCPDCEWFESVCFDNE